METEDAHGPLPKGHTGLQPPTVSRDRLDFGVLRQGSRKTLQEVISNSGGVPLLWTAHVKGARWITLDAQAGVLLHGEGRTLNVTVHTNNLNVGVHTALLVLTAESDEESVSKVVTLAVTISASDSCTEGRTS